MNIILLLLPPPSQVRSTKEEIGRGGVQQNKIVKLGWEQIHCVVLHHVVRCVLMVSYRQDMIGR